MLANSYPQALLQLDQSSPEFPDQLRGILGEKGFDDYVTSLQTGDASELIEYLDNVPSFR